MTTFALIFWAAFEFAVADPAGASLAANMASGSWQSTFGSNPALLSCELKWAAAAVFTRPYGLGGLYSGRLDVMTVPEGTGLGFGCSLASTSFEKYQEHDLTIAAAWDVTPVVTAGVGLHGMGQVWQGEVIDMLGTADVGAVVRLGTLRLGVVGRRVNSPKLHDESELPLLLAVGGSWQPVSDLLLALDLRRESAEESAAFGVEFRLIPQMRLRAGLVTAPLRYSGGIGVDVGQFGIDYAWQFDPVLKDTHVVGVEVRWR
uniref:PorV/PorQ family protein n=1 Tax=candidate division WOR-3 bacterium TaxID=2052148 RepID=A0A7C4GHK6_UNCW3